MTPKNPHLSLIALSPSRDPWEVGEPRIWKCSYCNKIGVFEDFIDDCPYEHPPCSHCGETPICAQDCKGIAVVLGLSPEERN